MSPNTLFVQAAETAAYMTVTHPDYAILAARIAVSNLHKQTKKQWSSVISDLYHYVNPKNRTPSPMIAKDTYECVMRHKEDFDSAIVDDRDFIRTRYLSAPWKDDDSRR